MEGEEGDPKKAGQARRSMSAHTAPSSFHYRGPDEAPISSDIPIQNHQLLSEIYLNVPVATPGKMTRVHPG